KRGEEAGVGAGRDRGWARTQVVGLRGEARGIHKSRLRIAKFRQFLLDIALPRYMLISMKRRAQLAFDLRYKGRGAPRKGAGRPRNSPGKVPHLRRPSLSRHHPVHVTLRLVRGLESLRSR